MEDRSREFERIYQSTQRDLFVYIFRSVRNDDLARDILQDSFVNFIKAFKVKVLPPDVNCRMYIFRIARNLIINYARSDSIRKTSPVPDIDIYSDSGSENFPESGILKDDARNEVKALLNELLADLEEEQRTAVILKYIQNMKLAEIADILDTSIATASRYVRRGMVHLVENAEKRGMKLENL
jgi:RNA polymerase sigma-70 factor (ECF subfamily)